MVARYDDVGVESLAIERWGVTSVERAHGGERRRVWIPV